MSVASAIVATLNSLAPEPICRPVGRSQGSAGVLVGSFREDLARLWQPGGGDDWFSLRIGGGDRGVCSLVVTWDGPPASESAVRLTDLVLWVAWRTLVGTSPRDGAPKGLPELRIHILDLHDALRPDRIRPRELVLARAFPWVQFYSPRKRPQLAQLPTDPGDLARVRSALPPGTFGIDDLLRDLLEPTYVLSMREADEEFGAGSQRALVESVAKVWAAELTAPGTRHHVSNLLGPMVLVSGLPAVRREARGLGRRTLDDSRRALMSVVEAAGLIDPVADAATVQWTTPLLAQKRRPSLLFEGASEPRVLLTDDQATLGFDAVVAELLLGEVPGEGDVRGTKASTILTVRGLGSLSCETSAGRLLRAVSAQGRIAAWDQPRWLDVGADVLLLDLRVFGPSPVERVAFLNDVLSACAVVGDGPLAAADERFRLARDAARTIVAGGDASELLAISLLPLLLSHVDPSLPVVLFSSTQQRLVVETLGHRPNIVTDFSKPLLAGRALGLTPGEHLQAFERAMGRGLKLLDVRHLWRRLVHLEPFVDPLARLIDRDEARSDIARLATAYLSRERYYDFLSVPSEWLEGRLAGDADYLDLGICGITGARRSLGEAIRTVRHRKVHGRIGTAVADARQDEYRECALLLLSMLLDFLATARASDRQAERSWRGRAAKVLGPRLDRHARKDHPELNWRDFLLWTFAGTLDDCSSVLSDETAGALGRAVERRAGARA